MSSKRNRRLLRRMEDGGKWYLDWTYTVQIQGEERNRMMKPLPSLLLYNNIHNLERWVFIFFFETHSYIASGKKSNMFKTNRGGGGDFVPGLMLCIFNIIKKVRGCGGGGGDLNAGKPIFIYNSIFADAFSSPSLSFPSPTILLPQTLTL